MNLKKFNATYKQNNSSNIPLLDCINFVCHINIYDDHLSSLDGPLSLSIATI